MAEVQLILVTWLNIVGQGNESMLALLGMFFTRSDADGALFTPQKSQITSFCSGSLFLWGDNDG
jgi:hypothetical protein